MNFTFGILPRSFSAKESNRYFDFHSSIDFRSQRFQTVKSFNTHQLKTTRQTMEEFLAKSNNRRARERSFSNVRTDRAKIFGSMEQPRETKPQETQSSIDMWTTNIQSLFDPSCQQPQQQRQASEEKAAAAKGKWRQINGLKKKSNENNIGTTASTPGRKGLQRLGSRRFAFRNAETGSLVESDAKSCVTVYHPTNIRSPIPLNKNPSFSSHFLKRKTTKDEKEKSEKTKSAPSNNKSSLDFDLMRSSSLISNGSQEVGLTRTFTRSSKANQNDGLVLSSSLLGKGSDLKRTSSRLSRKSQDVGLIRSSSFISRGNNKDSRVKTVSSKQDNAHEEEDEANKEARSRKGTNIFRARERSGKDAIDRFSFRRSLSSKRVPSHVSDADDSRSVSDISEYSSDDSYSDITGIVTNYLASPCATPCAAPFEDNEVISGPTESTMIETKNERMIILPLGKPRGAFNRDGPSEEGALQEADLQGVNKPTMDFKKPNYSRKIALMQTLQRAKGRGREFREIEL